MNDTRLIRLLGHWRTWWDLGSFAFAVCLLTVLFGSSILHAVFGRSTPRIGSSVVQATFLASILCFFAGFACLTWRQRTETE